MTPRQTCHNCCFKQGFVYTDDDGNSFAGEWQEFESHGIPKPVCQESQFSRINHLGNVEGGYPAVFNWTIPTYVNHERCVMRIRYIRILMQVRKRVYMTSA